MLPVQSTCQRPNIRLLLAAIYLSDDERIQPQRSQRFLVEMHWGHLTHYPIQNVHDNAAGPPWAALAMACRPPGLGLALGCRSGSGGRMCALVCGRWRPEEQYFYYTGIHASIPSAVTIICYRRGDDERIPPQSLHSSQRTQRDLY